LSSSPIPQTPKQLLTGRTLASGWTLVEQLQKPLDATGGNFGVGYRATRGSETAFVKAVDFVEAMSKPDPMAELHKLTSDAKFEQDVLAYCTNHGMSRVMRYLGHEYLQLDSANPMSQVSCLIMEVGDEDLRRLMNHLGETSCVWTLKVMSDVSLALTQLHKGGIAHQDIKPSNVISVGGNDGANNRILKVGDLGRVTSKNHNGPFDSSEWPGDRSYSPPERWYRHVPTDWNDRRESADAYMLGSLLIFLSTGTTLQSLVVPLIPQQYLPDSWGGSYDQDLLTVLVDAHARVLEDRLRPVLISEIEAEVMRIAIELTHPDPRLRGDTRARRQTGRPVGLDRIHQRLRLLSMRAAANERGRNMR
jgi:eukaryotic-like serine/threonine-protein kinase